jgi:hypothetical protein
MIESDSYFGLNRERKKNSTFINVDFERNHLVKHLIVQNDGQNVLARTTEVVQQLYFAFISLDRKFTAGIG